MTKILPISRFTVNGNSMFPTLKEGQDVLSFNWAYFSKKPKVGDIVIIKVNGKEMVKRIQSMDGRRMFVMGDNEGESTDSRNYGPIGMDQIVGKVIYKTVIPANAGIQLTESSSELDSRLRGNDKKRNGSDIVECPQCGSDVVGIYGRKDAICKTCGFKMVCCGE